MLFTRPVLDGIGSGEVTVAFRSWKRPTVRAGGTLQTPAGLLAIDEVAAIAVGDITPADVAAAGAASVDEVTASLRPGSDRTLYRIRFHRLGDDPRVGLAADGDVSPEDREAIAAQLRRWDDRSADGPWTAALLDLIAARPGQPSRLLAEASATDQVRLKRRVRRLKGLGLTESLTTGYRLSPRGEGVRGR